MLSATRTCIAPLLLALTAGTLRAQASTVTFDDQPIATTRAQINAGSYAGLTWGPGWSVAAWGSILGGSLGTPCHSDPYCLSPNEIDGLGRGIGQFGFAGGSRVFLGAWIATAATSYQFYAPERVYYELLSGGQVVHTSAAIDILDDAPVFVASGYAGRVDDVRVVSLADGIFVDDIRSQTTPEPATLALVGSGLLGLAAARRHRRG